MKFQTLGPQCLYIGLIQDNWTIFSSHLNGKKLPDSWIHPIFIDIVKLQSKLMSADMGKFAC